MNLGFGLYVILYSLLILVAGVVITLIYFYVYRFIFKKQKTDSQILRSGAYTDAQALLEKARVESLELIADAQTEANSIIESGKALDTVSKQEFEEHLHRLADAYSLKLAKLTQSLTERFDSTLTSETKVLQSSTSKFESELVGEIRELKAELHQKFESSQRDLLDHTSSLYTQVQSDVDAYKVARMKLIDEQAADLVKQAAKDLLRVSLTPMQHELIVLEALDESDK